MLAPCVSAVNSNFKYVVVLKLVYIKNVGSKVKIRAWDDTLLHQMRSKTPIIWGLLLILDAFSNMTVKPRAYMDISAPLMFAINAGDAEDHFGFLVANLEWQHGAKGHVEHALRQFWSIFGGWYWACKRQLSFESWEIFSCPSLYCMTRLAKRACLWVSRRQFQERSFCKSAHQ